ncbi:hypothetical protein GCM10007963_15640 [Lutibacter litoralis]|nr:hypothetical protein GCM10007963_15640 [Lutibacter litoralis]
MNITFYFRLLNYFKDDLGIVLAISKTHTFLKKKLNTCVKLLTIDKKVNNRYHTLTLYEVNKLIYIIFRDSIKTELL